MLGLEILTHWITSIWISSLLVKWESCWLGGYWRGWRRLWLLQLLAHMLILFLRALLVLLQNPARTDPTSTFSQVLISSCFWAIWSPKFAFIEKPDYQRLWSLISLVDVLFNQWCWSLERATMTDIQHVWSPELVIIDIWLLTTCYRYLITIISSMPLMDVVFNCLHPLKCDRHCLQRLSFLTSNQCDHEYLITNVFD